jgi:hypothetical protein
MVMEIGAVAVSGAVWMSSARIRARAYRAAARTAGWVERRLVAASVAPLSVAKEPRKAEAVATVPSNEDVVKFWLLINTH